MCVASSLGRDPGWLALKWPHDSSQTSWQTCALSPRRKLAPNFSSAASQKEIFRLTRSLLILVLFPLVVPFVCSFVTVRRRRGHSCQSSRSLKLMGRPTKVEYELARDSLPAVRFLWAKVKVARPLYLYLLWAVWTQTDFDLARNKAHKKTNSSRLHA